MQWKKATLALKTALEVELTDSGFAVVLNDGEGVRATRPLPPDALHGIEVWVFGTDRPKFCTSLWVACPTMQQLLSRIGFYNTVLFSWGTSEITSDGSRWRLLEVFPGNEEHASCDLARFLKNHAVPFLSGFGDRRSILARYEARRPASMVDDIYLAALKCLNGEMQEAEEILSALIQRRHLPANVEETIYPQQWNAEHYLKPKAKAFLAMVERRELT